ncbi:UDP-4-amino-4,6-dideoxy-N-acetyl-beta-L-altrosamine transaminase [Maricaulis sp.]|uniref:UDP-4-amino-4, 6-dideoxy-N-acetyl-beta-L-altrosamine transaminase n=1 Tax=Maricaulis sp. TaxID=1486257 RepID=UPI003A8FF656
MPKPFLPYGRQSIDDSDIEAVARVLRSDWLTTGPEVDAFEADFAATTGAGHAIACSNGTTALHLALAGLDVGPGDVCIVPAITFMATANAAIYCGADVVFADVDAQTGLMTPDTLRQAIGRVSGGRLQAVLPVHLAGQCEDMAALREIATAAGAKLVEDACHALGTSWRGQPVGAGDNSDAACFSFHPVKTIAAGEGGMVTTNDAALAARLRRLRSHGIERDPARMEQGQDEPWWHEMQELGWNYRLCDVQAALARSQLSRLDVFAAKRKTLAAAYDAALEGHPVIGALARTPDCDPCLHLYPVRIDFVAAGTDRASVMNRLRDRGIGSQVHYIPVPSQPWYRRRYGNQTPAGAAAYYQRTLSLPLFADMAEDDPERVVAALNDVLGV